jgi:YggT family protein
MQPAPDPNQAPADPSAQPTVPLVPPQQGIAGGRGLMPIQSTIPSSEPPPLPMKQGQHGSLAESPESTESQETTEVETFYSSEVDAPTSPSQRMRRTSKTIRYIFIVIEIVLALRFFLKLMGANPASPFGVFLFGITDPLAAPFDSLFANPELGSSEVEFTTLLALVVYPVFGWVLIRGIQLMFYREQGGLRTVRQKQHTGNEGM